MGLLVLWEKSHTMSEQPQQPQEYDLIVIGSGPAGQKAALAAAKHRFRVALIDQRRAVGGACLHTGTIPSKTLREAVLYFTGHGLHNVYGAAYRPKEHITRDDLTVRIEQEWIFECFLRKQVLSKSRQKHGVECQPGDF